MKKASLIVLGTLFAANLAQAKMTEFKGRSHVADKNGNSVCRLEIHQNDQGETTNIVVRGYYVVDYKPGLANRAIGIESGSDVTWKARSVTLADHDGNALEKKSCSLSSECLQIKSTENLLEIRQKEAGPVEDTYQTTDTVLKITGAQGAPEKVEISEKSVAKFMIFKDTSIIGLSCSNLKAVN